MVACVIFFFVTCFFFAFRTNWIELFTKDPALSEKAHSVLHIVTIQFVPDLWQGYMQGPIKALGLQAKIVPFNLTAYWIINLPLACLFAFTLGWGFAGVWISMVIGQLFMCTCQMLLVLTADWQQAADESRARRLLEQELLLDILSERKQSRTYSE